MQSVDDLAKDIAALSRADQEILIEKVARLNLQKGLAELAEKYRSRLANEGRLNLTEKEAWQELDRVREEVADRDYPN